MLGRPVCRPAAAAPGDAGPGSAGVPDGAEAVAGARGFGWLSARVRGRGRVRHLRRHSSGRQADRADRHVAAGRHDGDIGGGHRVARRVPRRGGERRALPRARPQPRAPAMDGAAAVPASRRARLARRGGAGRRRSARSALHGAGGRGDRVRRARSRCCARSRCPGPGPAFPRRRRAGLGGRRPASRFGSHDRAGPRRRGSRRSWG